MAQAASAQQQARPLASHKRIITRRTILIFLAVALLSLIVFANTLTNDFVWDDVELIVQNPAVHSLSNIPAFFAGHFWAQSSQPSARGYYRPMVLLSYAADYHIWGKNPLGFHVTNMLLNAVASVLVCLLILRLSSSSTAAFAGGLLFAVLPVHVESVAFVSGRTDVLATVFVLLSFNFFLSARKEGASFLWLAAAVLAFCLGLFSKEVAAVLPVLLVAFEVVRPQDMPFRKKVFLHLPFWFVLGAYLALRVLLLRIRPDIQQRLSFPETMLTMPGVVLDYLRLLVLPIHLCADYAVNVQHEISIANVAAIGALAVTGLLTLFLFLRRNIVGFFVIWLFVCLLPVLQIVPISVLKAERFLYLPSVGYCVLAALAVSFGFARLRPRGRPFLAAGLLLVLLAYSWQTISRNKVWKSEFALYRATAASAPDNFRAQYNLGNAYFRRGDIEQALRHTLIAYELKPDFPQIAYNLGVMYEACGQKQSAEAMYRRAIQADPSYAQAHNNLAAILFGSGNFAEAEAEWKKVLALDPGFEQARQGLLLLQEQQQAQTGTPR